MQWLELLVSLEAACGFVLASLSCLYLIRLAREAHTAARRAGASALALVGGALSLESILFLSQAPLAVEESPARTAAVVLVRSILFAAAALISVLIWRSGHQ